MASTSSSVADDTDNFKAVFKKYKRRDRKLDLSDVVDVDQCADSQSVVRVEPIIPCLKPVCGTKPVQEWKTYHFLQNKGFYLIRNPFLPGFQRYWVSRCLSELPQPPNVTNLRVHPDIDPHTLWSDFVSHCQHGKAFNNTSPLRKLRWTTIGYHYNWDIKEYNEDDHTPFPEDIGVLSHYIAEVLGFSNFQAEAGIINYYHLDSTLAGHTDHSELDHEAPLISVSFGQDAIFLLGGLTKATDPTAILLRSGDICVMSGSSRLAYHAVPRILPPASSALPACFETFTNKQDRKEKQEDGLMSSGDNVGVLHGAETSCNSRVDSSCRDEQVSDGQNVDSAITADTLQQGRSTSCHEHFQTGVPTCMYSSGGFGEGCTCTENGSLHNVSGETFQRETCTEFGHIVSQVPESNHSKDNATDDVRGPPIVVDDALVKKVNHRVIQTLRTLDWEPFAAYLRSSRLNVNIRQVLKPGQTFQRHTPVETEKVQSKRPRTENLP